MQHPLLVRIGISDFKMGSVILWSLPLKSSELGTEMSYIQPMCYCCFIGRNSNIIGCKNWMLGQEYRVEGRQKSGKLSSSWSWRTILNFYKFILSKIVLLPQLHITSLKPIRTVTIPRFFWKVVLASLIFLISLPNSMLRLSH